MTTNFTITKGLPFARVVRVTDGKNVWPQLVDFEVRSHLRAKPNTDSTLIAVLHTYMAVSFDANDILISWSMTGAQTDSLAAKGSYDIVISDPGGDDARAVLVLEGTITLKTITTARVG